jgi:hypothetical protein
LCICLMLSFLGMYLMITIINHVTTVVGFSFLTISLSSFINVVYVFIINLHCSRKLTTMHWTDATICIFFQGIYKRGNID